MRALRCEGIGREPADRTIQFGQDLVDPRRQVRRRQHQRGRGIVDQGADDAAAAQPPRRHRRHRDGAGIEHGEERDHEVEPGRIEHQHAIAAPHPRAQHCREPRRRLVELGKTQVDPRRGGGKKTQRRPLRHRLRMLSQRLDHRDRGLGTHHQLLLPASGRFAK